MLQPSLPAFQAIPGTELGEEGLLLSCILGAFLYHITSRTRGLGEKVIIGNA